MGMHRSGTSALSGLLHAAGISAGTPDELVPPRPENPHFYGERSTVVDFNDRLLGTLGWTWDAPAATPDPSPPANEDLIAEGRVLVDAIHDSGAGSIKDPRISVLLPWWRRMLLDRFIAVIPVRAPDEVAWSLSVRDGLPFELGLAIWAAYHRHLASGLEGLPTLVVDYAALTQEPEPVVRSVLAELARLGISRELDVAAAVASIHPVLRRATQPARMSGSGIAADVLRNLDAWTGEPVRGVDRFAVATVDPAGWEVALLDLQRGARHAAARLVSSQRDVTEAEAATAEARSEANRAREAQLAAEQARVRDVALAAAEAAEARKKATLAQEAQLTAEAARTREVAQAMAVAAAAEARTEATLAREDARHAEDQRADDARAQELARERATAARSPIAAARGTWPQGIRRLIVRARGAAMDRPVARRLSTFPAALRPNPLFDAAWYRSQYRDVTEAGADPYRHYRRHGRAEGRDPNGLFSTPWYLAQNPDVQASGMDPLEHYFLHGAGEGRDPSPQFDTDWYLDAYPDVRAAGMNPLLHYLRHGRHEGRSPRPVGQGAAAVAARNPAQPNRDTRLAIRGEAAAPPVRVGVGGTLGSPRPSSNRLRSAMSTAASRSWLLDLTPALVPVGSQLLVMTGGDERWLRTPGLRVTHLPSDGAGGYPAVEPASDTAVIAQLEWQRSRGAAFLVIPDEAFGLLQRLPGLASHVATRFESVASTPGRGTVRDLRTVIARPPEQAAEDHTLEDAGMPAVSIVIPNFGSIDLLTACLRSLRETLPMTFAVEVIVVDDASPTDSRPTLEQLVSTMPTGQLIFNDTNTGFLASANRGAAAATGDLLVLLNNDTVTLPGWLEAIVGTFQEHPEAGVVGGRLVYPDGRLQEAGGLVFVDGTAAKLGYGDADPDAPMYTFLRDTDYVSGALLATPRELFESLDGLDPAFGFGFYEDTDYCFRVRQAGRRVLYQPDCVVIHVEGGTAGVDTSVGPKRSQVENQVRFAARWSEVVGNRPARPVTARPEDWYAAAIRDPHDHVVAT